MSVQLTRQDEFALITLNRPEALNALSAEPCCANWRRPSTQSPRAMRAR